MKEFALSGFSLLSGGSEKGSEGAIVFPIDEPGCFAPSLFHFRNGQYILPC